LSPKDVLNLCLRQGIIACEQLEKSKQTHKNVRRMENARCGSERPPPRGVHQWLGIKRHMIYASIRQVYVHRFVNYTLDHTNITD
jgi:hypothetical protein